MITTSPRDFARQLIALIDTRIRRALQNYKPQANKIDGQIPPSTLPPGGDTGGGYTPAPHDHDDRYWTKPQADDRYAFKAHTHDYLPTTGGTIDGSLNLTGDLLASEIYASRVDASVLAATIGMFVAPAGIPIGGIDVDGKIYASNITTTPTPGAIPRAREDGTIDPAWTTGTGGGSPLPSAHAITHATGGSDPISPGSIGASTPAELAAAIATHADTKASTSATGHVKADGTTTTIDADGTIHAAPRTATIGIYAPGGTAASRTWSNMPALVTELFGGDHHRYQQELAGYSQARLQTRTGGSIATGATLRAQYSTDNGSSWSYLDGTAGPQVALAPATSAPANLRAGAWVPLAAAALAAGDVLIRVIGQDGDGVADPNIGQVLLQLK